MNPLALAGIPGLDTKPWETGDLLSAAEARAVVADGIARWRMALPASGPRLGRADLDRVTAGGDDPAGCRTALAGVVEEILNRRWLRIYAHKEAQRAAAEPLLGFPLPTYRSPAELMAIGLGQGPANEELWQRDVGDAMPALALGGLVLAEPVADACRRRLHDLVLAACSFPTWGTAHPQDHMDLAAAHLVRGIAVACDWHRDLWNGRERAGIAATLRERAGALLAGGYGAATWARSWPDNHCHIAFAAIGLCGLAWLDDPLIPEAAEWIGAAEAAMARIAAACHGDGSSPEGLPYWSYGMSFLAQYLELADGITGCGRHYQAGYFRQAATYRLHASTCDLSATLPFGDAVRHDYYGPRHILHALARRYSDPHAQWLADAIPFVHTGGADVEAWTWLWRDRRLEAVRPTLHVDHHLPVWDVAVSRSSWAADGCLLAVKSGYTNRSHSHLDAGAIVLAWGGEWLLTAPGYGQAGPGFWDCSNRRWTYWSNASESHGTLLIDGANQRHDPAARGRIVACTGDAVGSDLTVDLGLAYAGVTAATRRIRHRRGSFVLVVDRIAAPRPVDVEWLLQPGGDVMVADGVLNVRGRLGSLRVRMLSGGQGFVPRAPRSRHCDIPAERMRTHAAHCRGASVEFVCLISLAPAGSGQAVAGRIVEDGGGRAVVVDGDGWSERIALPRVAHDAGAAHVR